LEMTEVTEGDALVFSAAMMRAGFLGRKKGFLSARNMDRSPMEIHAAPIVVKWSRPDWFSRGNWGYNC
jgi:hypothetical protein